MKEMGKQGRHGVVDTSASFSPNGAFSTRGSAPGSWLRLHGGGRLHPALCTISVTLCCYFKMTCYNKKERDLKGMSPQCKEKTKQSLACPQDLGRASQRGPKDTAGPAATLKPPPQPAPWTETKTHHTPTRTAAVVGSLHMMGGPAQCPQHVGTRNGQECKNQKRTKARKNISHGPQA